MQERGLIVHVKQHELIIILIIAQGFEMSHKKGNPGARDLRLIAISTHDGPCPHNEADSLVDGNYFNAYHRLIFNNPPTSPAVDRSHFFDPVDICLCFGLYYFIYKQNFVNA